MAKALLFHATTYMMFAVALMLVSDMKKELYTDAYRALTRPGNAAPDARL